MAIRKSGVTNFYPLRSQLQLAAQGFVTTCAANFFPGVIVVTLPCIKLREEL